MGVCFDSWLQPLVVHALLYYFVFLCNLNVMGAEIFSVGGRKLVFFPTVLLLRFCAFGSSVLPCELRSKMALIGVSDCQIQDNNDKTCEV